MTTENNSESNLVEQPKAVERHGFREFLKKPIGKLAIVGAGLLTVVGLSVGLSRNSEADPGSKGPVATHSAEPTVPETTPSAEPTPTNTPEKPSQEVLNINYASFENWDNLSEREKRTACEGFYATNPVESDVIQSENNTGIEIAEYFDAKLERIFSTALNTTNKDNLSVAKRLIECATTPNVEDGGARKQTLDMLSEVFSNEGEVNRRTLDNVTRYSDGLQVAVGGDGSTMLYKVVEYNFIDNTNGLIPSTLRQAVYEWTKDYGWRKTLELPGDANIKYGNNPPVIVDQSRANAPWQG